MYLSKLILNPAHRSVWRDINNCHELHKTIMSLFPQCEKGKSAREYYNVLYRLETYNDTKPFILYVQSECMPDWMRLYSINYLLEPCLCRRVDDVFSAIPADCILRFRLKANPTKKVGTSYKTDRLSGNRRNGRRIPLKDDKMLIDWLNRKGLEGGFEITTSRINKLNSDVTIYEIGKDTGFRKRKHSQSNKEDRLTFEGVVFEGHLRITDSEKFYYCLKKGIGSGKAYGFGLLSIAKP